VFIETNSKFLGKGWPLYRKPAFPLRYRVRLGQRFEVDGEVKSAVTAMERYHREAMASPIRAESSPQRERSAA
jgi:hypothetical protein